MLNGFIFDKIHDDIMHLCAIIQQMYKFMEKNYPLGEDFLKLYMKMEIIVMYQIQKKTIHFCFFLHDAAFFVNPGTDVTNVRLSWISKKDNSYQV